MMHSFHRCDNGLASLVSIFSPKEPPPIYNNILVSKRVSTNPFETLPCSKDEDFKSDLDNSPKMCPSYLAILEEENDIINTFLNVTSPSLHDASLSEKVLMDIDLFSLKFGPSNGGMLVQQEVMNTSFKDLLPKHESLEKYVHVPPKKHSLHEDPFVQEDDIIPTFPSDGISFSNKIPTRDDELMINAYPSPKVCLTHKHPLEKEDEIISNFLNSLSPKDHIEHILRKEDEFNTSIDALPPKDEELINNVISSPEIDNTSNIPFNHFTMWDEPLE